METLAEVRAREEECEREWLWLVEALNAVAGARAEHGELHAFRVLQHQAVAVGQRRVELMLQRAALEKDAHLRRGPQPPTGARDDEDLWRPAP